MHQVLVRKGNLYIERSKPRYSLDKKDTSGEMKEGVGVVHGEVSAVSYDKFFLKRDNGDTATLLRGDVELPSVGSNVSVTYAGGEPPKALLIKTATTGSANEAQ